MALVELSGARFTVVAHRTQSLRYTRTLTKSRNKHFAQITPRFPLNLIFFFFCLHYEEDESLRSRSL